MSQYYNLKVFCAAVAAVVAPTAVGGSIAGTSEYADSVVSLSEVSVSAIKSTSERVFPSMVSLIGSDAIERYDLDRLKDISEIVPNFFMPQYGSRMTSSIYVRGLGTRIDQPVITLNVDNVPILNKNSFDFNLPDLCRIEMVRGAQSILYGRNTMGGVVNISTLSPLNYSGVRAETEYASGNSWRVMAGAYGMLSSTVGLGVTGAYSSTDGFYRNLYTGRKVDNERQGLAKIKLSWRPSHRFILENSVWTTITRQGGYPYQSVETGRIDHNDTCFYKRTSVIDGLTMRYYGDNLSISSITGFQYLDDNMTLDQDFLPQDYFTLTQKSHEWSLSQDFVVKGSTSKYNYLGGLFGFYKRNKMDAPVTFGDYGITHLIEDGMNSVSPVMKMRWDERSLLLNSRFRLPSWGWAVYHQSEYSIDKFTASLGLRLAFEREEIDYLSDVKSSLTIYNEAGPSPIPVMQIPVNVSLTDKLHMTSLELLPELKLKYEFMPEFSAGFVIAKGHKSGGYNTQMFSDILQQAMMSSMGRPVDYDVEKIISYKPEKSINYELNFASALFGQTLMLNASLFYIDCRDQQMTVFPEGSTTGRVMTNAGRTRNMGVELTGDYNPSPDWNFSVSYGFTDACFREYNNGIIDCRGNHVPYAPRHTLFTSGTLHRPLSGKLLTGIDVTLSCRGAGKIYWNEENTIDQPFYALMGASVNLRTKLADIELWGENLTATKYSAFYFESIGHSFIQRGTPRKIGVTLRFNLAN